MTTHLVRDGKARGKLKRKLAVLNARIAAWDQTQAGKSNTGYRKPGSMKGRA